MATRIPRIGVKEEDYEVWGLKTIPGQINENDFLDTPGRIRNPLSPTINMLKQLRRPANEASTGRVRVAQTGKYRYDDFFDQWIDENGSFVPESQVPASEKAKKSVAPKGAPGPYEGIVFPKKGESRVAGDRAQELLDFMAGRSAPTPKGPSGRGKPTQTAAQQPKKSSDNDVRIVPASFTLPSKPENRASIQPQTGSGRGGGSQRRASAAASSKKDSGLATRTVKTIPVTVNKKGDVRATRPVPETYKDSIGRTSVAAYQRAQKASANKSGKGYTTASPTSGGGARMVESYIKTFQDSTGRGTPEAYEYKDPETGKARLKPSTGAYGSVSVGKGAGDTAQIINASFAGGSGGGTSKGSRGAKARDYENNAPLGVPNLLDEWASAAARNEDLTGNEALGDVKKAGGAKKRSSTPAGGDEVEIIPASVGGGRKATGGRTRLPAATSEMPASIGTIITQAMMGIQTALNAGSAGRGLGKKTGTSASGPHYGGENTIYKNPLKYGSTTQERQLAAERRTRLEGPVGGWYDPTGGSGRSGSGGSIAG